MSDYREDARRMRWCGCFGIRRRRSDPQADLREGSRGGDARGSQRARSLLAAVEVAVATVLLVGAGMLMRSFARLLSVSPGFETVNRVKAEISLPRFQYSRPEQWAAFANELMTRLQAKPGLQDSAIAAPLPIMDDSVSLPFAIAGNPPTQQGATDTANYVATGPGYFRVMGISLVRGRLFSEDDSASTPPVALISEALARRYFPGENPLGRQLIFGFPPHGDVSRNSGRGG
jgi:putative ABC transport system permease protein